METERCAAKFQYRFNNRAHPKAGRIECVATRTAPKPYEFIKIPFEPGWLSKLARPS